MAMVSVRYIGRRPFYKDALYGTNLEFEPNTIRNLPPELAKKFLRHSDLFDAPPEVKKSAKKVEAEQIEETAFALAEMENARKAKEDEVAVFNVVDQVRQMDKDALEQFGKERFGIDIDKRRSLDTLREEVVSYIERFG